MTSSRSASPISARQRSPSTVRRDDSPPRHRLAGRRTGAYCDELDACGATPVVRATTGLVLDSYFSASKMRWFLDHGHMDDLDAPSFATVDSWLVWWLSGGAEDGAFVTEPSNASRTMLMDLATMSWSNTMTTLFDVDPRCWRRSTVTVQLRHRQRRRRPGTGRRADHRGPRRPTVGALRSGLLSPGRREGDLRHRCFILANVGENHPGVFDGLITTLAWDLGEVAAPTYAVEDRRSSPARPCSGYATRWDSSTIRRNSRPSPQV